MTSSYRRIRTLMMRSIITLAAFSATAQVNTDLEPPDISRVCLWNADQTTWKALGLKRSQIARMQELRLQYPGVVDGQWVGSVDDVALSSASVPARAFCGIMESITFETDQPLQQ